MVKTFRLSKRSIIYLGRGLFMLFGRGGVWYACDVFVERIGYELDGVVRCFRSPCVAKIVRD